MRIVSSVYNILLSFHIQLYASDAIVILVIQMWQIYIVIIYVCSDFFQ